MYNLVLCTELAAVLGNEHMAIIKTSFNIQHTTSEYVLEGEGMYHARHIPHRLFLGSECGFANFELWSASATDPAHPHLGARRHCRT